MSDINLTVDGIPVSVPQGSNIIKATKKAGQHVPYFCYHEGLTVVGQCRMCFVEVEGMPKLATACSTPVAEGMKVITQSEKVQSGQNASLEFTLLNHPLDCPICDRGGECKLQDYTYQYGPPRSRMEDEKVLRDKHKSISDQIVLDQERCILCTRCVRFSSEIDGKAELVVNNRGNSNVIDVFNNAPLKSAFSGNVVDLCPVGALTAQDFRFAARPWELKSHEAICTGCSMGCNVEIDTKHRHPGIVRPDKAPPNPKIVRLTPRKNQNINRWWMCDEGRWGYHFHNNDELRLHNPMLRRSKNGALEEVSLKEIQRNIEEYSNQNAWEFWIEDTAPHEEISWAKELRDSWIARGRKVEVINPSPASASLLNYWKSLAATPQGAGQINWTQVKKVYSPISLDTLEKLIPILKLKIAQAVRESKLQWIEYKDSSEFSKLGAEDLLLLSAPKNDTDLKAMSQASAQCQQLVLWTGTNSRGLLNEGLAPIEYLENSLQGQKAKGPIFLFAQSTQRKRSEALAQYLASAPLVIVADSFQSIYTDKADLILPIQALYETRSTLTSVENYAQVSPGVSLNHPNQRSIHRGGELVAGPLKLL